METKFKFKFIIGLGGIGSRNSVSRILRDIIYAIDIKPVWFDDSPKRTSVSQFKVFNLITDLLKKPFRHCVYSEPHRFKLNDNLKEHTILDCSNIEKIYYCMSDICYKLCLCNRTNKLTHIVKSVSNVVKYNLILLFLNEIGSSRVYLFIILFLINHIGIVVETVFLIPNNGWIVYTLWYQAVFILKLS